jgi:UDP-N-acetylmuramoyl-tripeptide--D-alanyl-D-alanine ligase
LLHVDDTLAGLHRLGGYARERFAGRLVAVTGSVGKTTTKEMLRTILARFGRTHAAVASYNNHWGLPLTLARMPSDAEFCVAEIGMNHPGEIAPLARLARPHVAVITTVEKAHIGRPRSCAAWNLTASQCFRLIRRCTLDCEPPRVRRPLSALARLRGQMCV